MSRSPSRLTALVVTAALAALSAGCGHPASKTECEELFTKAAEIEVRAQRHTDPKLIEERIAAARAAEGERFLARCTGKRITARALECVRRATTVEQYDRCL